MTPINVCFLLVIPISLSIIATFMVLLRHDNVGEDLLEGDIPWPLFVVANSALKLYMMAQRFVVPPEIRIHQLSTQIFESYTLYVAAKYGFADAFQDGESLSVQEISKRLDIKNERNLYRILRALVSIGIFEQVGDDIFKNNRISRLLRSSHKRSQKYSILHLIGQGSPLWYHLDYALDLDPEKQENDQDSIARRVLHGKTFWEYLSDNEGESEIFDRSMTSMTSIVQHFIVRDYDFGKYNVIADIGGGKGALLRQILEKHGESRGILFDLEHVIQSSRNDWEKNYPELFNRTKFISGDFFSNISISADAYVLRMIVHDWTNKKSIQILKNVRSAIQRSANSEDARLLIIEFVIGGPWWEQFNTNLFDVHMLTMVNGVERTKQDFGDLLIESGFELVKMVQTRAGYHVIEAKLKKN